MSESLNEDEEAYRMRLKIMADEIMMLMKAKNFTIHDGAFTCAVVMANLIGYTLGVSKENRVKTAMDLAGSVVTMTSDVCDVHDAGLEIDDDGEPIKKTVQ